MDSQTSDSRYEETLQWLFSQLPMFSRVGAPAYKAGLDNTIALDKIFNHPHRRFETIHVAGTNGKGSTSHMIASVLSEQGYKTGLYTSPHLVDFRERIKINGKKIPKEDVINFVDHWRDRHEELQPSFFELTMMMAFDWFAREEVDYAVVEVGMGGRLDSTNIIMPKIAIITNISFDHTQFLGKTLEAIAAEKAGIMKPNVPVVIGHASDGVRTVFEEKAAIMGSPLVFAEEDNIIESFSHFLGGWKVRLRQPASESIEFSVPLAGMYQQENIRTAISALKIMQSRGIEISQSSLVAGLEEVKEKTGLRGRWETVNSRPLVICDTGHNIAGITEIIHTLHNDYSGRKIKFILGFVADKDVDKIITQLPRDAEYCFTQAAIPRAMPALEVRKRFNVYALDGRVIENVREAYDTVIEEALENDIIFIGGSTFVVADLIASLEKED